MTRRLVTGFALSLGVATALAAAAPANAQQLMISEFRLSGPPSAGSPDGSTNEFVEIYNPMPSPHFVQSSSGSGYAIASSDGVVRAVLPNGMNIPGSGHVLAANIPGYSLEQYPAGNVPFTSPDVIFMMGDTPAFAGIALFTTDIPANFSMATRLDAVGPFQEMNPLYKEGAGYPALSGPFEHAVYRDNCGKSGISQAFGNCPFPGVPFDTNDNLIDFVGVSTIGAGRFGAPGPESRNSPVVLGNVMWERLDPCVPATAAPNLVRDFTPVMQGTEGTVEVRYRMRNQSSAVLTDLRVRIVDLSGGADAPPEIADVRAISSASTMVTIDDDPCGMGTGNVVVEGTQLDEPPVQADGGGLNSSLTVPAVMPGATLDPNAQIAVRVLLAVSRRGPFKFRMIAEAHTGGLGAGFGSVGGTEWCTDGCPVVTGLSRSNANPTANATVDYQLTFDRAVQNVSSSDLLVFAPAFPDAFVQSVSGMGATRTVTVNTGGTAAAGTLSLSLEDRDTITSDGNGVLGGRGEGNGTFGGEPYDIDRARPTVTIDQAAGQSDPAGTSSIAFKVVFSEPVGAFATGDVTLGGTAGATTALVSGGPSDFDVLVSGMTANGTVTASVAAAVCADPLGNTNTASTSSDNVVTFNGLSDSLFGDGFENP